MYLEKLPTGRWRAVVGRGATRRSVTRRTKGEARLAGAELAVELGQINAFKADPGLTAGELIERHLTVAAKRWSPYTIADARSAVKHLPEAFSDMRVADVTPAVVKRLYRNLADHGVAVSRIRRIHMVMSTAWAEAVEYEDAVHNPCRDVRPPPPTVTKVKAPDVEQLRALLASAEGLFLLFITVAAGTGARRGEVVALRWANIDLERNELIIDTCIVIDDDRQIRFRNTKTGRSGHRTLALDLPTATALRRWRANQSELAFAHSLTPEFVFSDDGGVTPWFPERVSAAWTRTCKKAGVTGLSLNTVRHFVATNMLQAGVPLIDVSAQLGHASVTTTAHVYAHAMPGRGREDTDRRATLLHGKV